MEVKLALAIGIGLFLFTTYYLEKQVPREQIFWGFAGLGVATGIASVYTVARRIPSYDYFITFAVLFILLAILYFDEGEAGAETKAGVKKRPKKTKKKEG